VLRGRVVTFDDDQPVLGDGAAYSGADERIHAVEDAAAKPPDGFANARTLRTGGAIYSGLIDLHNHIPYNGISLWTPPGRDEPYTARLQWPDDPSYDPLVSDPGKLLGYVAGKAQLKYAETKAFLGGVTAIQGSARTGTPYRNVIESSERDVLLVTCNGYPMYGTVALMKAAGAYAVSEPIRSGAGQRRIRLAYDWIEDADWGWKRVLTELADARSDPRAYLAAHPQGKQGHVELQLDKPFDVPKEINLDAVIPPPDSLTHDTAFFAAVKTGGFHGGQLNGLKRYYDRRGAPVG
jgi:hypothetical protein